MTKKQLAWDPNVLRLRDTRRPGRSYLRGGDGRGRGRGVLSSSTASTLGSALRSWHERGVEVFFPHGTASQGHGIVSHPLISLTRQTLPLVLVDPDDVAKSGAT